jgi:tRNA A37 threonylcarbamoyladenosine biosynthesis protein TsaE
MEDEREIEDLDLELYMPPDGIALVEWAQRAAVTRWPESRLELALALEGQGRHATLRATAGAADVLKLIGSAKGVA